MLPILFSALYLLLINLYFSWLCFILSSFVLSYFILPLFILFYLWFCLSIYIYVLTYVLQFSQVDGDDKGLIYWLGTKGLSKSFSSPMSFGQLNVQSSGMVTDKGEKIIILVLFLVGDKAIFYLESPFVPSQYIKPLSSPSTCENWSTYVST